MRKILVATDLGRDSENAFIRAIQLSQLSGATLHVLHVAHRLQVPGTTDESALLHDEIGDRIRDFVGLHAGSSSFEFVAHIENHGRVHERIIQYARTVHPDLVVIGRSARPDVLPDSVFLTTGQVLENAPVPVLVVIQPVSGNYRHILLEADLSTSPADVLKLVRAFGAESRLTLLAKSDVETDNSGLLGRLSARLRRRSKEKFTARVMAPLVGWHSASAVSVDFVSGDYEGALLSKLRDEEIDLVGLIHMRDKLRHRDSEIHIIAALQTATCDVLTFSR